MRARMFYLIGCVVSAIVFGAGQGLAEQPPEAVSGELVLMDFSATSAVRAWEVEDDVVMGGVSEGAFAITAEGHGVFSGEVSLENNGGFSSVQYDFDPLDVSAYSTAVLRVKGDGKRYQFRVETGGQERHSYIHHLQTSGEWETITIPLKDMYPSWRGNRLDLPNYAGRQLAHIRFLIGNGKQESFRLEIDKVSLR